MEKMKYNYRNAIIFDMDGVVFNTEHIWKKAFETISAKYDLPLDYYDYKEYLHDTIFDKKNLAGTVNSSPTAP